MNYLYAVLIGVLVVLIVWRVKEKIQEDTKRNNNQISQEAYTNFGLDDPEKMKKFKFNIGTIVSYMHLEKRRMGAEEIAKLIGSSTEEAEKYMKELAKNTILTKTDENGNIVFDRFK